MSTTSLKKPSMLANDLAQQALDVLFDPDDFVWVTDELNRACISIPLHEARRWIGHKGPQGVFLCGNPSTGSTQVRANSAALSRTFLIEFDKYPKHHPLEGQPIPLDEQEKIMEASGIPWTTKTFSGGKSYHYLIRIFTLGGAQKPIDEKTFKKIFFFLSKRLNRMNDQGCNDPARWSRFPGCWRGDVEQTVLEVRRAVPLSDLPQENSTVIRTKEELAVDPFSHNWGAPKKEEDRTDIIAMLDWYCEENSVEYKPSGVDLPCPACRAQGRDNHGDNFRIWGDDYIAKCWTEDAMHSREALSIIAKEWREEVGYSKFVEVDVAKQFGGMPLGIANRMWRRM